MNVSYKDLVSMGVLQSPAALRRRVRRGTFPKPISGGSKKAGPFQWRRRDVECWLADRVARAAERVK